MPILALAALVWQLTQRANITELLSAYGQNLDAGHLHWLALAILLMPLNWWCEIRKWQLLSGAFSHNIGAWQASKVVLAGAAVSALTPNRVGDYVGRILLVAAPERWKTIAASLTGSFAMLLGILGPGLACALAYLHLRGMDEGWPWFVMPLIVVLSALGFAALLVIYFNVRLLVPLFFRFKFSKKWLRHLVFLRHYDWPILARTLGYSLLRFGIYSVQYYCMAAFFSFAPSLMEGIAAIGTIYLVQTGIPLPPLTGLAVRGSVAIEVWGYWQTNELLVLSATFGLWILNVVLPALVGLWVLGMRKNDFPKK